MKKYETPALTVTVLKHDEIIMVSSLAVKNVENTKKTQSVYDTLKLNS